MYQANLRRFAGSLLIFSLWTVSGTLADVYDVTLPIEQYGNLNQQTVPEFGNWACGPSAATNGYVYLENAYPELYGRSLVPPQGQDLDGDGFVNQYDDMIATVQILGGETYMRTAGLGATPRDLFIAEQAQYIEDRVPGVTTYSAQATSSWQYHERQEWCEPIDPEWDFIYGGLTSAGSVSILVSWTAGGHYLTLNGFHWNDANDNGVIDRAENATLDFMDPWGGEPGAANVWFQGGHLRTNYVSGSSIYAAFVAVPIPEPATGVLTLLSGLIWLRKRG
jgi:hypothetical protein